MKKNDETYSSSSFSSSILLADSETIPEIKTKDLERGKAYHFKSDTAS